MPAPSFPRVIPPRILYASPAADSPPGAVFSPPAGVYLPRYTEPPRRFDSLPQLSMTHWSGQESWSSAVAAGRIPSQGNVYYSPVTVYDFASMRDSFKAVGGNAADTSGKPTGIYEKGGLYYSVVDLNGSPVLQPISFGGKEFMFGAYQPLSDTDKRTLADVVLAKVGSRETWDKPPYQEENDDAVKFSLSNANPDAFSSNAGVNLFNLLTTTDMGKNIPRESLKVLSEKTDLDLPPVDKPATGEGHKP